MYPFKGFEVHYVYDDFTMPTFDDKHNLIKGGSWSSTGNLQKAYSRYAFRRHFMQHAGFRPVVDGSKEVLKTDHDPVNVVTQSSASAEAMLINPYETDPLVNMYCLFDFAERINCLGMPFPQFPVVQAILCEQVMKKSIHWG